MFLFYIINKNSVRTSQETHYISVTKIDRLMLFIERIDVYCENHAKHANTLCGQNADMLRVKTRGAYRTTELQVVNK
jgi:hypothetical protein